MPKRLARLSALFGAILLIALPASASAAPQPWWQVLPISRPTNMWIAGDSVQEIKANITETEGFAGAAARIDVGGKAVGCLGTGFIAPILCESDSYGKFPTIETAPQLEVVLKTALGNPAVEVTGGPVGGAPFIVRVPKQGAPTIAFFQDKALPFIFGDFSNKVLSPGGSGRLVASVTNLGDAPVDATSTPLTITDQLPEGVEALNVSARAGVKDSFGPVSCEVKAADEVSCSFEGTLPSYEAIEVETSVNLTGEPPAAGAPGKVSVSGANAKSAGATQEVKVSPEPTPFGIEHFSSRAEEEGGEATTQAGAHPFQVTNTIVVNSGPSGGFGLEGTPPEMPRNLRFPLPSGLVGNAGALPQCPMNKFLVIKLANECPDETAIGATSVAVTVQGAVSYLHFAVPVFNLTPAFGEPARFGFMTAGVPVVIDTAVDPDDRYRITARVSNITQLPDFWASSLTLWGTPGDPRHDPSRGWNCTNVLEEGRPPCEAPTTRDESAFLRAPVSCDGPLDFDAAAEPWNVPVGSFIDSTSFGADALHGCNRVPFDPKVSGAPTSKLAANPSGFDFRLELPSSNLNNPEGIAEAQPKKVEVTLPEGVTVNPSSGEGLVGCTPAEFAREKSNSEPGAGCPNASRIGDVKVQTPLLKEEATGGLFIAAPHNNPFNSLLGLYLVARIPERGIIIKLAGKVDPDPRTGQLTTTFDDLPQLPFSTFNLHFREGGRAPLVTPPTCGTYTAQARFVPWSAADVNNPAPNEVVTTSASFQIERGVDGGACPPKSTPPFHPGLLAGTINNAAGSFSDFNLRLSRNDGEQEFTHFSIKLPPGISGKLAGIPYCSESAIAQARSRTGIHGGQEELDNPSCPAASQIGRTLVGSGVGSILTYVPGKLYLAGPYNGAPLSMVAITSGVVGPFDIGAVVIRQAFRIDPETGEVFIDATSSDPIPHIIQGIPVHARDIRAYVDRPNFTLNPTSCKRTSTASTVLGSGLDFASAADDNPITVTSPFQAADCAALPFGPKLRLKLKGGTKRGAHPAFTATLKGQGIGAAGIARTQVTLPRSEFIENAHFKTICTRVQFKAAAVPGAGCPAASIYGKARATTPILSDPLTGPVFLRSSEHQLPDLVIALHSPSGIDIVLVGRVDSVDGQLRTTFEQVPDAPVSSFVLQMQGGKKGLFVNSTNLCKGTHRAGAEFDGQNGKQADSKPEVKAAGCKGGKSGKSKRAKRANAR
jgi:hypothetical protein